jgi:hypothetical protein
LEDVIENGHKTYLSISSQGLGRRYLQEYVVKIRDPAEQTQRKLCFLEVARECAVDVVGIINRWQPPSLIGFIMPLERVIDPAVLSTNEKMAIFKQMKTIVPEVFGALSTIPQPRRSRLPFIPPSSTPFLSFWSDICSHMLLLNPVCRIYARRSRLIA